MLHKYVYAVIHITLLPDACAEGINRGRSIVLHEAEPTDPESTRS